MTTSEISPPATVGFVGLGNMGQPMATNLAKAGYRVVGFDLDRERVGQLVNGAGAEAAENLQSLGEAADVVITMLPEGRVVRAVLTGDDGVCAGLRPGRTVIDMSSCSPVDTRVLARELAGRDVTLVDAPVSGGVVKAVDGSLAIMAGGDADAIGACRPVLEAMGKVFVTGASGTGHAMKAMNNYLSAVSLAATSEAVLAGKAFGLDPAVMVDIINASTGRSNSSEHKFPTFILNGRFDSGFFLGLMAKDLRFAKALTESTGTPHTLLAELSRLYDEAEGQRGFDADNTDIYRHLAHRAEG